MKWKIIFTGETATGFEDLTTGTTETLKKPMWIESLKTQMTSSGGVELEGDIIYSFKGAGGAASTTSSKALLEYIFTKDNLFQGTERTDPPAAKGFLTSTSESSLLDFYKFFAYNDDNYKLIIGSPNVEVSFLCSDRRSGVAGSRRAWSPYFKLSDLEKTTFTLIQNDLVGTDTTAGYNIQGKITRNANGDLFITVIDSHSGNNLYGSVINIRHRIV